MRKRTAIVKRKTKETGVTIKLNIDGSGKSAIRSGIGILDHMLELFAFHGLFDLDIKASGDLKVDIHHTNEDVGIVLGQVFKKALGDKKGIKRFGAATVPMEDVVASATVDISGRGYFNDITLEPSLNFKSSLDEGYSLSYANHFLEALAKNMGVNLAVKLQSRNPDLHTNIEPVFKALGLALDEATQIDPRRKGVPSTKGVID